MQEIYFLPWKEKEKVSLLLKDSGMLDTIKRGDWVGLKIHFGEKGNKHFIPPTLVKIIGDAIKDIGAKPFLIDTNVLYKGGRGNTYSHLQIVREHGFSDLGIPAVIAGGIKESLTREAKIKVNLKHFNEVYIVEDFLAFDFLLVLTHFKGHMMSSFGGSIKNVGMGCASRRGKFLMHSSIIPRVNQGKCTGCGRCVQNCPGEAMHLERKKVKISPEKCIGCGECVHVCPVDAISIPWDSVKPEEFQERIVEYAYGVQKEKKGKIGFINFLCAISPDCDCIQRPKSPLVPDLGILIGWDMVGIDQASLDMVTRAKGFRLPAGINKFYRVRPDIPPERQLEYGAEINLGKREYRIISCETP
ncbi:MAG: DUF362 domain-containing protein [Caldiserica bacterium]|nr:DUF362 domain-containing protein [Caldisericota bacterium]